MNGNRKVSQPECKIPLDSPVLLLVKPSELSLDLTIVRPLLKVLPSISLVLSFSDTELNFDPLIFPIKSQRNDGSPLLFREHLKPSNLLLVKEEAPIPERNVELVTRLLERANIALVEPAFSVVDPSERLPYMHLPFSDRLYLRTAQLDPGLVSLNDRVVASRFSVGDNVFHARSPEFQAGSEFRRLSGTPQVLSSLLTETPLIPQESHRSPSKKRTEVE